MYKNGKGKTLMILMLLCISALVGMLAIPNATSSISGNIKAEAVNGQNGIAINPGQTVTKQFYIYYLESTGSTVVWAHLQTPITGLSTTWDQTNGNYPVNAYNGSNAVTATLTITADEEMTEQKVYPVILFEDTNYRSDTATITLTTTVGAVPSVRLGCADNSHTADAGDSQTFSVTITNSGNIRDTFSLSLTSITQNWKAHIYEGSSGAVILDPTTGYPQTLASSDASSTSNNDLAKGVEPNPTEIETVTLNTQKFAIIQVCVVSPTNATNGATCNVLLTATSQEDGSTNNSIYLNTTIAIGGGLTQFFIAGCSDTDKEISPTSIICYTITVTNPSNSTKYFLWSIDVYSHSGISNAHWVYWDYWLSDLATDTTGSKRVVYEDNLMSSPIRILAQGSVTGYLYIDSPEASHAEPGAEIIIDITVVPTTRADYRSYTETTTTTTDDFTGSEGVTAWWAIPGFDGGLVGLAIGAVIIIGLASHWRKRGEL